MRGHFRTLLKGSMHYPQLLKFYSSGSQYCPYISHFTVTGIVYNIMGRRGKTTTLAEDGRSQDLIRDRRCGLESCVHVFASNMN